MPPPPRSTDSLIVPGILNSHIGDSQASGEEHYIPPKTLNDVPKNFIRPEDLPEPPSPDFLDIEVTFYGMYNVLF